MTKRPLTKRQEKALRRAYADSDHALALSRDLANQLVRRGLASLTGQVYERTEWNRVTARLPVVVLTPTGVSVAAELVNALKNA